LEPKPQSMHNPTKMAQICSHVCMHAMVPFDEPIWNTCMGSTKLKTKDRPLIIYQPMWQMKRLPPHAIKITPHIL
jgi:hypothetical protein